MGEWLALTAVLVRPAAPTLAILLFAGCTSSPPSHVQTIDEDGFRFTDEADAWGLADLRWSGSRGHGKIIATIGGGIALGDVDGDGDLDLWVTQGPRNPDRSGAGDDCGQLLRNEATRGFVDATKQAGIAACGWGMGAIFEDFDGDGDLDLFTTMVGPDQLWLNRGDGSFAPGIVEDPSGARWHTGLAALDIEGDGDLDLYLAGYVHTTPEIERRRSVFRLSHLDDFETEPDVLLENIGQGRFRAMPPGHLDAPAGRGLGVVAADFDRDGRPDLFVANDRDRNTLLRNLGQGRLGDVTEASGTGRGENGEEQAGMGVAVGDLDGNGFQDLVVANYAREPANLFLGLGDTVFAEAGREQGVFEPSYETLNWATELVDFDQDGRLDLYLSSGHLLPSWVVHLSTLSDPRRAELRSIFDGPWRQPVVLLRGGDEGLRPTAVAALVGVWRGGIAGDLDSDGDLDLVLLSSDRRTPTVALRNDCTGGHWLGVAAAPGAAPPPPGSEIVVTTPDRRFVVQRTSGGSFLSGATRPLHVGLGTVDHLDLETPSTGEAVRTRYLHLPSDRVVVLGSSP